MENRPSRPRPDLGRVPLGTGPWAPPDGRIVDLGLHSCVGLALGNHVQLHTPFPIPISLPCQFKGTECLFGTD